MAEVHTNLPRLISMADTAKLTTLSHTTINQRRARGEFPQAVKLGAKRIAFVRSEVQAWIDERISSRTLQ